jgi:hypothetical protein
MPRGIRQAIAIIVTLTTELTVMAEDAGRNVTLPKKVIPPHSGSQIDKTAGSEKRLSAPTLDYDCLVAGLSGSWDDKGGQASSYSAGGSEYRLWWPDTSYTSDGGLYVSFKMDHIRRFAADDHAILGLTFDSSARLIDASVTLQIAGEISWDFQTGDPDVDLALKLANEIYTFINSLGGSQSGGRLYFSEDIKQNINRVDSCTR